MIDTDYSGLCERLGIAEKYLLNAANGDITNREYLHAEACYRAAEAIRSLQSQVEHAESNYRLQILVADDMAEKLGKSLEEIESLQSKIAEQQAEIDRLKAEFEKYRKARRVGEFFENRAIPGEDPTAKHQKDDHS